MREQNDKSVRTRERERARGRTSERGTGVTARKKIHSHIEHTDLLVGMTGAGVSPKTGRPPTGMS